MAVKRRDQLMHYMSIKEEGAETASYFLINEGVTTFDSSLEAQTEEVHYIAEQNPRTLTNGVNASYSFTAGFDETDPVSLFLYNICANQVLNTEVEIVHVETWGSDPTAYVARKATYTVNPSKEPSGDPGSSLTMEGTLNQVGELTTGTFNFSTKVFTASE